MRILFLVQGEGRGHLTQALSLAQIVQRAGHDLVGAVVGVANERPVPAFFADAFPAPIDTVASPPLVYNPTTNELELLKTVVGAVRQVRTYARSISRIRRAIREHKPDVVVNFYELLGGLTYGLTAPSVPMVCVAHQYLAFHDQFEFPRRKWFDRSVFLLNTLATSFGARERLALSFDRLPDLPNRRLRVMPPLLRQEVTERQPQPGNYVLTYVTQPGLNSRVLAAHHQHPDVPIRCFHAGVKQAEECVDKTLTYHAIDGKRFLDVMQDSRAVATTAGFESVCEAFFLGKPVLMMPQPNHYEQACNALDGQRAGAGIAADTLDFDKLLTYLPTYNPELSQRFRHWQGQCAQLFLNALDRTVSQSRHQSSAATQTVGANG